MSTLPFLLSVADELDNLNSQTYMDDFGLGFHPHRHYYRNPNPSIQLSLPASTDWIEEKQRCRSHKFVDDESQNNCDDEGNNDDAADDDQHTSTNHTSNRNSQSYNTTNNSFSKELDMDQDQDNIDSTVNMYNLTKKCRKYNYGASTSQDFVTTPTASSSQSSKQQHQHQHQKPSKLSAKSISCPSASSSDESLQKTSMTLSSLASIEFLTCFPVKKNKTPKCSATHKKS